jgi:hypothetical protein
MSAKFNETFQHLKTWLWRKKFSAAFNRSSKDDLNIKGLRLIIGPGRSGTSWLSRVMAKTASPITFLNEPLHPFRIKLPYRSKWDHTALKYSKHLSLQSPLIQLYSLLSRDQDSWKHYLPAKIVVRNDKNAKYTLIKEVHSLLATEAILNHFNCPTILITRNPVYVVDSVLSFRGLEAPIWRTESEHVTQPEFLERFRFSNKDEIIAAYNQFNDHPKNRAGVIIAKAITVAMINKMLRNLAQEYDNALHITYEGLCEDPVKKFKSLASFLTFEMGPDFENLLKSSLNEEMSSDNPYSIFKNTRAQLNRPLRFLKTEEAQLVTDILKTCNLI